MNQLQSYGLSFLILSLDFLITFFNIQSLFNIFLYLSIRFEQQYFSSVFQIMFYMLCIFLHWFCFFLYKIFVKFLFSFWRPFKAFCYPGTIKRFIVSSWFFLRKLYMIEFRENSMLYWHPAVWWHNPNQLVTTFV